MTEQTRKVFNAAWYVLLFFLGFLIFFLFTFPYGVLKEAIVSEISQATGFTVRVKEMGPSFLVGMDASGVRISTADGSAQMELKSIDASVSLLNLFIGRAKVDVELVSRNNGTLDTSVSWGIWQLLVDKNYVPRRIALEAKDFELGGLVNVALHHASKTANDMIKDLLVQLIFKGNLSGQSEIKLAIDDPLQSTGDVELKIDKASLDLANPTLVVAKQNFKRAIVKASLKGGRLQIDNKSGFETQEIKTDVRGVVSLKNPFQNSILDITIPLKLEGTLKENFGFILSVVGGNEGQLNYKISGSIARPAFEGSG
ncbi:type II secretion system protein GspN [Oligoflexus tunisiensis]|uniref:type II secretion system protein GspN n=1 Tax=Oligoflexus tunisiensis TaxID=708132 RepID=UPI001C4017E6|nr:type II secretion system protein GspN [Oligoflexus tunisiensis]